MRGKRGQVVLRAINGRIGRMTEMKKTGEGGNSGFARAGLGLVDSFQRHLEGWLEGMKNGEKA